MTKKEMINRINEHAKNFTNCDGVYGIKGYTNQRLAAMLAAYERMTEYNTKCFELLVANNCTQHDTLRFSLMGDNAPDWYKEYWQYKLQAIQIWRSHY